LRAWHCRDRPSASPLTSTCKRSARRPKRVQRLTQSLDQELAHWRWRPVVDALQACRGIQLIHAVRIVAELGDLSRFSHPRQLMGYLGMTPSEDSSGEQRHQGAITKAGNSSARRALIEAAWAYQHAAKVSPIIARRQTELPKTAIAIAWKAQLRLRARFRRLAARGVNRNKIVVAIARELAGFVWAIARQIKPV
jgi:transposase